jgi:hypothetical protein
MGEHVSQEQSGARSGLVYRAMRLKTALVVLSLVALLATNIATLLSASVYNVLDAGLRSVLLAIAGGVADAMTRRSKVAEFEEKTKELKRRVETAEADASRERQLRQKADADLRTEREVHAKTKASLEDERMRSKQTVLELDEIKGKTVKHSKSAKQVADSVKRRLASGISRNTAAIPAESVPYIGIGVTLSMTALDIYDACETMKEINGLLTMLGQGTENPDFCGTKLPTSAQVAADLGASWRSSLARVQAEAEKVQTSVPVPQVRLPTVSEVKSTVCPLVTIPGC